MPKQRSQRQRHARVEADFVYDHTTPISPPTTRARGRAKARKAAEATTTHIEQVSPSVASTVSERDDSTDESAHTTDSDSDPEMGRLARKVAQYLSKGNAKRIHDRPRAPSTPISRPVYEDQEVSAAAVAGLLGECSSNTLSPHVIEPSGQLDLPVDAHVPLKLKQKIWADEYIEIKDLLPGAQEQPVPDETSPSKRTPLTSHYQWTVAFEIFVAVYTQQRPIDTPQLMKHASNVRLLAQNGYDWEKYDVGFRRLRVTNKQPWNTSVSSLWFASTLGKIRPSNRQPFRANPLPGGRSRSKCFSFNDVGVCAKGWPRNFCQYQHLCSHCGGVHPKKNCPSINGQTISPQPRRPYQPRFRRQQKPAYPYYR